MADTKLRSFVVNNLDKYNKFAEIQRTKSKKVGQRLNELIETEVKNADPFKKDESAVRTPGMPDLVIPNPFVMDQPKANEIWIAYLATLSYEDWKKAELRALEIKWTTEDRARIEQYQRNLKNGA